MHVVAMLVFIAVVVALTGRGDAFDKAFDAAELGRLDAAIHHYTDAIESNDLSRINRARAYNNRGVAYEHMGMYGQALADFEAALRLTPGDPDVAGNRDVAMAKVTGAGATSGSKAVEGMTAVRERASFFDLL